MRKLTLLFMLVAVAPAQAGDAPRRWISAAGGLNMRSSPSLSAEVVTLLPYGEQVELVQESGDYWSVQGQTGKWTQVYWKGHTGWVFGGFLVYAPGLELLEELPFEWVPVRRAQSGYASDGEVYCYFLFGPPYPGYPSWLAEVEAPCIFIKFAQSVEQFRIAGVTKKDDEYLVTLTGGDVMTLAYVDEGVVSFGGMLLRERGP